MRLIYPKLSAVPPTSVMMRSQGAEVGSSVAGAAGGPLELECTVTGCNPPPRLHWFVGSLRVEGSQGVENREARTVTSRLSVTAIKEDAGENVRCVVEHSALTEEMEAVVRLEIQCEFVLKTCVVSPHSMYRPHKATQDEMAKFHSDEYIKFLISIRPNNMIEYS